LRVIRHPQIFGQNSLHLNTYMNKLCPGCSKRPARPTYQNSLCKTCSVRTWRNGKITQAKEYRRTPECGHPERSHRAHGLCDMCYTEKWKRAKGIPKRIKPTITCGHPERKHHVHGMCEPCWIVSDKRKEQYALKMQDPDKRQKASATRRAYKLEKLYNLTPEDYDRMLKAQGGACAICRVVKPAKNRLSVDHDHATGKVRGLLCVPCNRALGYFENIEWLPKAQTYLQMHS